MREKNITAEYLNIAQGYEDLKKYSKAIEYYNLALQNQGNDNSILYRIAKCYALNKDWKKSEEIYSSLLLQDPQNLNLRLLLAYVTAMNGNLLAAEEIYAGLIDEFEYESQVYANYISVLMAEGKTQEAQQILELMKEKFPDNKSALDLESKIKELTAPENQE